VRIINKVVSCDLNPKVEYFGNVYCRGKMFLIIQVFT
jgi:hypothetical protein